MPGLTFVQGRADEPAAAARERFDRMQAAVRHRDDYAAAGCEDAVSRGWAGRVGPPVRGAHHGMWASADGSLRVILDGELVNGRELAAAHGGDPDDAPALLAGLWRERPDAAFLPSLRGWFNLVIIDRAAGRVLLANDRYGIRPLYFAERDGRLAACGEIKGVLAALGTRPELDLPAVADLFVFDGVLNERTPFAGVRRLPPASCWTWQDGRWQKRHYWQPADDLPPDGRLSREAVADAADACFARVLPRYLQGDYCFSLTGGNDTRVMMSMLGALPRPEFCFTYGLTRHTADILIARRVARTLSLPHHAVLLDDAFFRDFATYAAEAVWVSDGLGDVMSSTILHVHADHRNRTVAGGKYGTQVARGVRQRVWELAGLPNLEVLSPDLRAQVGDAPRQSLQAAQAEFAGIADPSDRSLLFTVLKECRHHWGGKLAMENTVVNVRTPFTDPDVVRLTLRMPADMISNAALQHELMRRHNPALAGLPTNRGLLPQRGGAGAALAARLYGWWFRGSVICNSRRVPPWLHLDRTFLANNATSKFRTWFRSELSGYVREMLLDRRTLGRSLYDPDRVRACVADHFARRRDGSAQISRLLSFELFLRQFVDGDRLRLGGPR